MLRNIFIFLFILFIRQLSGQCGKDIKAFKPGEKVTYLAYYNWGFVWVHAGNVEFTVGQRTYLDKQVYDFGVTGTSLKSFDWLYKVRDRFQSLVDMKTFSPMWAERNTLEGGFKTYENYVFTASGKILSTVENTKKPLKRDTLHASSCIFDVLSLVYFSRTIDFDQCKTDEKITLKSVFDNQIYSLYLRFKGRETIKAKDGKKYRCVKFAVLLIEGTMFKGGEDMNIWITDDENRIPVMVEAKILVGSVKAYLNTVEGASNEMKALVK
jgi:hypothetical protein